MYHPSPCRPSPSRTTTSTCQTGCTCHTSVHLLPGRWGWLTLRMGGTLVVVSCLSHCCWAPLLATVFQFAYRFDAVQVSCAAWNLFLAIFLGLAGSTPEPTN